MNVPDFTPILRNELLTATGCTEPGCAAYAGAQAKALLNEEPVSISISASKDMIKNVMGVSIPNCNEKGLKVAVCLGVFGESKATGLNILSGIDLDGVRRSCRKIDMCSLSLAKNVPPLYIQVTVKSDNHTAVCTIEHTHDTITFLALDGKKIVEELCGAHHDIVRPDDRFTIANIIEYSRTVPLEDICFLKMQGETNYALALKSLSGSYGLSVGKTYKAAMGISTPRSPIEAIDLGAALAAAASDARMAGLEFPVIINSGSGNQGITCSIPLVQYAKFKTTDDEQLLRALAMSNLIAIYFSIVKGRLSSLCGAFTASLGTLSGYIYLNGGEASDIEQGINIMIANLTGIICDGAKETCALKILSCIHGAGVTALMVDARPHHSIDSGIVFPDIQKTVSSLQKICKSGMENTDEDILHIMMDRK